MGFDEDRDRVKQRFAEQLKRYREAVPLSVIELADKAKMHPTTIHKIEQGAVVSIDTLAELLKHCGVSLQDFVAGFRSKDIEENQKTDHQMLKEILNCGFSAPVDAIQAALRGIVVEARRLKAARIQEARDSPGPQPRETGRDKKHAS